MSSDWVTRDILDRSDNSESEALYIHDTSPLLRKEAYGTVYWEWLKSVISSEKWRTAIRRLNSRGASVDERKRSEEAIFGIAQEKMLEFEFEKKQGIVSIVGKHSDYVLALGSAFVPAAVASFQFVAAEPIFLAAQGFSSLAIKKLNPIRMTLKTTMKFMIGRQLRRGLLARQSTL